MGLLKMISNGINAIWNYFLRLIMLILVFFLYLYLFLIFSTDGSSNIFMYLFYIIMFSIPIIISRIVTSDKIKKSIFGFTLIFYTVIIFAYYSHIISIHIGIWLVMTSLLLLIRVRSFRATTGKEPSILLPSASLILSLIILAYGYLGGDSFFKTPDLSCSTPINTGDIIGLSQESKKIIYEKNIAIVDSKSCSMGDNKYEVRVRPIKNKFFTKQSFVLTEK